MPLWQASDWSEEVAGFCETNASYNHEWGNTISSLPIIFFGIYGLYQLPPTIHQVSDVWQWVFCTLCAIGFGSTAFHWTLQVGWRLFDALPMIVAQYLALSQFTELNLQILLRKKRITIRTFSILSKSLNIAWSFAMIWVMISTALHGQKGVIFGVLFGGPLFLLAANGFWTASLLKSRLSEEVNTRERSIETNVEENKVIYRFLTMSCSCGIAAGIIWFIGKVLCDKYPILAFFHLHSLWHIVIGWSMYIIIQCAVYTDFNILTTLPGYFRVGVRTPEDGNNCCQRMWFRMVTVLYYEHGEVLLAERYTMLCVDL